MEEKPKNLWKPVFASEYQLHATTTESEDTLASAGKPEIIYMKDLEKRKQVYGICGECNEPGTGAGWCQPCNAKRFKDNFKNWTSGNKDIDETIQYSQLNALWRKQCLEWIPFEKFQDITYIAEGGFGKIYRADWPEGNIRSWNIQDQKWNRNEEIYVALKSLNNSSDICSDFLNEIKSHLQIYLHFVVGCYGITQNPNTKEYMMVLSHYGHGNLRNYLNKHEDSFPGYTTRILNLRRIANGLLEIHKAGKVHKDFHSGNILISGGVPSISDLGMCQPANKQTVKEEGIYGVLPYMAPEVLRGHQYTKASDIYSFGIIMNEYLSEEIPYNDIPHDEFLAIKICKGQRPKISNDIPKLLVDLIIKCWDAEIENRPTAKGLYQLFSTYYSERFYEAAESYVQIRECDRIREKNFESRLSKNKTKSIQTHPQAIYTSRLLNFKNLPKPVNSSNLSSLQFKSDTNNNIQSTMENPISECLDVQLSELELNEICQDDENNIE